MQTQRIQVVVIDNAHYIDAIALEWLLALREALRPQIAVIFCAQLQEAEKSSHTLNLALRNVPTARDLVVDRFQLAELNFEDFLETVFDPFLEALQLDLDDTYTSNPTQFTELVTTLWSWSKGNWVLLDTVGRFILDEYKAGTAPYRLTPKVIEIVRRKVSKERDREPDII